MGPSKVILTGGANMREYLPFIGLSVLFILVILLVVYATTTENFKENMIIVPYSEYERAQWIKFLKNQNELSDLVNKTGTNSTQRQQIRQTLDNQLLEMSQQEQLEDYVMKTQHINML